MVPVASLLQLTLQHFVILALGQATSPSLHLAPRLQQETSHQVLEVFFLITLEGGRGQVTLAEGSVALPKGGCRGHISALRQQVYM